MNATDAAILTLLLECSQLPDAPPCILIASDQRRVRAAQAEGFQTLNPGTLFAADVAAFFAAIG